MFKVGDRLIVTGRRGHFIPVGSKVTVVKVDNNDSVRTYEVEDERGLSQWVCNDDLQQIAPPSKITQNGYEYSLVGPVKPEWLVDGVWVVNVYDGKKRLVKEVEPGVFNLCVNDLVSIRYHDGIRNQYRPHEPKDWKWGDWAMYDGKRVFVMTGINTTLQVVVTSPGIDDECMDEFDRNYDFIHVNELTPTF